MTLVKGDLDLFRPEARPIAALPEFTNEFEDLPSVTSGNPVFPKGLLLVRRLVIAYSLRPVASNAQRQVAVPNGLNLDKWIVPPPKHRDDLEVDDKKRKKKKGKGKARAENGVGEYGKSLAEESHQPTEDEAEVAAVRSSRVLGKTTDRLIIQRRAQRLARQQEDPYYITNTRPNPISRSSAQDIDAIPIVRLDDMPSLSARMYSPLESFIMMIPEQTADLTPSKGPSYMPDMIPPSSPKIFEVDRDGELPTETAGPAVSHPGEPVATGLETPEAIVVKRVKKKVRRNWDSG